MGLFTGMSIFSMFEIVFWIVRIIGSRCKRSKPPGIADQIIDKSTRRTKTNKKPESEEAPNPDNPWFEQETN